MLTFTPKMNFGNASKFKNEQNNSSKSCDLSIFMTSVLSVTVHFDELCIVAWDADYRHENMVVGSCAQTLCTVQGPAVPPQQF